MSNRFEAALIKYTPWAFLILAFFSALSISKQWSREIQIWLGFFMIITIGILHFLIKEVEKAEEEFRKK